MQVNKVFKFLIFSIALLSVFTLNGQSILDFDTKHQGGIEISDHLLLLEDLSGAFEIEHVAQLPPEAFDVYTAVVEKSPLNPKNTYWLRLDIQINGVDRDSLILSLGAIDQAVLFWKTTESTWQQAKTGWMIPKSEKVFSEGRFTMSKFLLRLPANTPISIYIYE